MQALPSIPTVAPPLPESKSTEAEGESQAKAVAEAVAPNSSPFELDTSNIIPVNLAGPAPQNPPTPPWVQSVMHWDGHIVIDRHGPTLCTDRCCECNADADRTLEKKYSLRRGNNLGRAFREPLRRLGRPRSDAPDKSHASVEFGMCNRCANRRSVRFALGIAGLISSVSFLAQALISGGLLSVLWIVIGLALLLAGAYVTVATTRFGKPERIDNRWIILKAGGTEFRESLEQSSLAQF